MSAIPDLPPARAAGEPADLVVRGAAVLTLDAQDTRHPRADVVVRGGRVVAVGPGAADGLEAVEEVDGRGRVVLPGLVNAHAHLWQTGVRGQGSDWSGFELHLRTQSGFATAASVEFTGLSTLLGALALLDAGVTGVVDFCHGGKTTEHAVAAMDALRHSGIRALFARGTVKTLPRGADEAHFSTLRYPRDEALAVRDHLEGDELVRPALAVLGPSLTPLDVTLADLALAAELGLPATAHVGRSPGAIPRGHLDLLAAGADLSAYTLVHGTQLSDDELHAVLGAGAGITATSAAEVRTSATAPVVSRVVAAGGTPSLGSDSAILGSADMFTVMRDSLMIDRLFGHLARAAEVPAPRPPVGTVLHSRDEEVPPRLSPSALDVLRWATSGGAQALHTQGVTGVLEPGRRADLVVLDLRTLHTAPALNPVDAVVGFGSPSAVETVVVDGRVRKRGGRLLVSGVEDLVEEVTRRGRELVDSLGFETFHDAPVRSVY